MKPETEVMEHHMTQVAQVVKTQSKGKKLLTIEEFIEKTKWKGSAIPVELALPHIFHFINDVLDITEHEIKSSNRKRQIVTARNFFFKLVKVFCAVGPTEGAGLIGRPHCTFIHANNAHDNFASKSNEGEYREKYLTIFSQLKLKLQKYCTNYSSMTIAEIEKCLRKQGAKEEDIQSIKKYFTRIAVETIRFKESEVRETCKDINVTFKPCP